MLASSPMENEKLLLQELVLTDQLLECVNTKEEYEDLIARAKEICPFWLPPAERLGFGLFFLILCKTPAK
jgi:hypothetical protein